MTKPIDSEKMMPVPISMPKSMKDALEKEAQREKEETDKVFVSISSVVRRAITLYLEVRMYKTLADWAKDQDEPKE